MGTIPATTVTATSKSAASNAPHVTIVLTGFMGSGKTSTGRALAELLGWEFCDLDEEIERQELVSVRDLFRQRGEAAFRALEREALSDCLERCSIATILALGGGAFLQPKNVELLRASGARTVFLETPVEEMLERCGVEDESDPENSRPLAADASAFRTLYEQRLPSYRTAELTVSTAGKTVEQVAGEIAELLQLSAAW